MKTIQFLLILSALSAMSLNVARVHAQDPETSQKSQPEIEWDVNKEFDEHGNIIHYDSSYSWTWKDHCFPELGELNPFETLDSLFGHFFGFPDSTFAQRPFAIEPFMDSLALDFYLDSSLFDKPFGFRPFKDFPDSIWRDSFFPDSLFPDAFLPFGDIFPPDPFPFHPRPFHGPEGFFERHHEWLERFQEEFPFSEDTLDHFHPKWQQLPEHQKKSVREIEI